MKNLLPILLTLILLPWPVVAGEDGIVVRSAPLYARADDASKRLGQVEAGTAVSIEARSGGWKRIVSEKRGIDGWIRSYQVRNAANTPTVVVEDAGSDSRGFLAGLASLSRKASSFFRSGSNRTSATTATIGVRGLSAEQIRSATADFDEFEKMQQFASNKSRAGKFARQGGLSATKVPYVAGKK